MDAASRQFFSHKIKTPEELRDVIGPRPRKRKVIMCHGTFDVVHPGHVRHLLYAKTKADILIASLTADVHIKKGDMRPYVPEDLRAINLAALEMVDYVIIDRDPTPLRTWRSSSRTISPRGTSTRRARSIPRPRRRLRSSSPMEARVIFTPG